MSSKKTTNYKLHQWEPADDFLRREFNENFGKLDEAVHGVIVTGSYTGDGADSRTIRLGFTPRLVFLITSAAQLQGGLYIYGGVALKGQAGPAVAVAADGFTVRCHSGSQELFSNGPNYRYFYWALR